MSNNEYNDPIPPNPIFISSSGTALINSSANFYRTFNNSNVTIPITTGTFIPGSNIYISPTSVLPINTFNSTNPNAEVSYLNNNSVQLLTGLTCFHDIKIEYKLTKSDGTNYTNQREIRVNLVKNDEVTEYKPSISSNTMPNTGDHNILLINGYINHNTGEIVKIQFYIVQDTENNDISNTLLTIFRISWNIL
jgi:hypothetical protein